MKDANLFANYKKIVNSRNVILLCKAGSEVLGLAQPEESDRDETGVCLEDIKDIAGLSPFEQVVYRTAEDRTGKVGAPSEPGDIDLTIYGLRRYLKLALGGNPNIVNLLYTPASYCIVQTDIGAELQRLAPSIVSKHAGRAFLGYLQAQKLRLTGTIGQKRVKRPDLVDRYGFDVKYATHLIRLGVQGNQLLAEGRLTLPLPPNHQLYLNNLRTGHYTLNEVLVYAQKLEHSLKLALDKSTLPDKPDYDTVEKWLLGVYLNYWRTDATGYVGQK